MTAHDNDAFAQLFRKLGRLAKLATADREAIRALPFKVEAVARNATLVREGDQITHCCILIEGYACRHKVAKNGGRQIVSFHLPGDLLDLQHLFLSRADHNVQTISEAQVAWVRSDELMKLAQARPAINEAFWRYSLIDASIFREWVLNVGRRNATSRIAHMLCEFAFRREAAGQGSPESFELPFTQEEIGDATGLTNVHVNRMLKELARTEVIDRDKRHIRIADWGRMCRVADFDPAYLHAAA
jgi:CRP-like cAMP-binding protein